MKKVKINRSRYYYKIINANYGHPESMQYHLGLNEMPGFSKKLHRGIYFTDIKHIFAYVNYGPIVCVLTIPEDATVIWDPESLYVNGNGRIPGWFTDKVEIKDFMDINDLSTIWALTARGADVSVDEYSIIRYALRSNVTLWEYFKSQFDDGTLSEDVFYRAML